MLVAITALVLNNCGFTSMDSRFASIETRMLSFESRVDARLNLLRYDLKDLYKTLTTMEIGLAKLKDKAGL